MEKINLPIRKLDIRNRKGNDMKKEDRQVWEAMTMVFQFGLNMLVPIFLCTMLGVLVSEKIRVSWIVIIFFFVGALAGYTNIFKMAKRLMKDDKDVKKDK